MKYNELEKKKLSDYLTVNLTKHIGKPISNKLKKQMLTEITQLLTNYIRDNNLTVKLSIKDLIKWNILM